MGIRVAHVNVAKSYRGGERQTELLIQGLRGEVEQLLIARRGAPLVRRIAELGFDVRPVSGHPLSVAAAARGVDLVHVHEGRSVYGAWLRALISRTPYVVTRRVDNPIGRHVLAHLAYRGAAYVVAVAPQVADVVRRFDPHIEPRVIHSSSSGLEADPERVQAIRGAFSGKLLVGNVAALDNRQKGQEFIIDVARRLEASHPHLHFMLVGGGEDETVLKQAAAGLGNLSFAGFVENVGDYLGAFDAFVLPSRREGIGSILLDAMEHGVPIVASRVGGVPEIVRHEENGLLVEPERPDELMAAILRLADSPELRRRLGERGREVARAFTVRVMREKYLELYRTAAGDKRTG